MNILELRLFSTKEMKRMTAKHYKKLPEVQEKILDTKRQRTKQTNKLLASIFNQVIIVVTSLNFIHVFCFCLFLEVERNGLAWTGVPVNQYQCY